MHMGEERMTHNSINLDLRIDKPDNVWRFIYAWQESRCGHDIQSRYIFLHALVQWDVARSSPENVFTIAIQYSTEEGRNVDVSQPAHILEEDIPRVLEEFQVFVQSRMGMR